MNVQIRDVSATPDPGAYRILLEVGPQPYVFVVRVERDPVVNVQAPHSFWLLCESNRVEPGPLLRVVEQVDAGEDVEFPVSVEGLGETPYHQEQRLWAAKSGAHVSKDALRQAATYFATHADTSLFPRPFEYTAIAAAWDDLGPLAQKINLLEYGLRKRREYLTPKSSGETRPATQLDPLDTLLLTAVVFELGATTERARISIDEGVVHSFRFSGENDELWDETVGWSSFQRRTRELVEEPETAYIVETDISSFYHRIPIDVAAHALERAGGNRRLIEGVRRVLHSFAPVGLPVGPIPSAFFAEAVLNEVDASLLAAKSRFVRFNDDYRFFCKSEAEAKFSVELLSSLLWRTAGLSIQHAKTKYFKSHKYLRLLDAKASDDWLTDLKADIKEQDPYSNPAPAQLSDEQAKRVRDARERLLQAIGTQHLAWIQTSQKALAALPLRERLVVMPELLQQLTRLKAIARDISTSVAICGLKIPEERTSLLDQVLRSIDGNLVADENDKFLPDPDYTRTWLMRAFSRTEWPHADKLLAVAARWPNDVTAKREIMWALRREPELVQQVEINLTDPWLRRVLIAATRVIPRRAGGVARTVEQKWDATLEAIIANFDAPDAS